MRTSSVALAACGWVPVLACGTTSDLELDTTEQRIIGGTQDDRDPSVVAVVARAPGDRVSICSGSVISPTRVLTAAHCIDPGLIAARIGADYELQVFTGTDVENPLQILEVSCVLPHPGFDPDDPAFENDIALLTLAEPTTLRRLRYNAGALGEGKVRIVGFGANARDGTGSGIKRQVRTTIQEVTSTQILVGKSNRQACVGDSGGPTFQTIDGKSRIVGVHSSASGEPSICYNGAWDTRVDAYVDFIEGPACPATCGDLPSSWPDGDYFIDPNGGDTSDAFEATCDFSRDDGGWTLFGRGEWWTSESDQLPPGANAYLPQAKRDAIVESSSGLFRAGDGSQRLFIRDASPSFGVGPIVPNTPAFHYWRTTSTTVSCATDYAAVLADSMTETSTRAVSCDPTGVGSHLCGFTNGWLLMHQNDTFNDSGDHPCAFGAGFYPTSRALSTIWVR